jgi:putative tryptophan/tyrosine transport system substrate-binding protein
MRGYSNRTKWRTVGRRALLASSGAMGVTLVVQAQQRRPKRIAWMSEAPHPFVVPFRSGLDDAGLVEQRDFVISTHYEGSPQRLGEMARSFDAGAADIVVASGGAAVDAARQQITSVPLFIVTNNTVGLGLVFSLARPGKNVSGFDLATDEFAPKWLERMVELLPNSRRIAVLMGEERETRSQFEAISAAAPSLKREVFPVVATDGDFNRFFADVVAGGASGAISCSYPPFAVHRQALIAAAAGARVPVCYPNRIFTMDGGLISYGPDFSVVFRRVGILVARIVRGEPPEMIPVERPTQLELVVNKRSARAIGLVVPELLLALADEVIE